MKYIFELSYNATHKDLEDMVELDKLTYLPEDSADIEELENWFKRNNDICVLLKNKNKLIGYSIFFPLTKKCYENYINGKILEGEIKQSEILKWVDNSVPFVLFNNISIHPQFQNGEAVKIITLGIRTKIKELKNRNINLLNVVAECDSPDGKKYLTNNFGFQPVGSKNSRGDLYVGKML